MATVFCESPEHSEGQPHLTASIRKLDYNYFMLFHGSKIGDIKILEPKPHGAVNGESVVFATKDRRFALAMIHGTGDQLAFDYEINKETGNTKVYLDETEVGALKLLEQPGYLYTVSEQGFTNDLRLIPEELISRESVTVIDVEYFPNILDQLKREELTIVSYDQVPQSMESREKDNDLSEYDENRFKKM